MAGGLLGVVAAFGLSLKLVRLTPGGASITVAVGVSLLTSVTAGIMPARRATRLDPVQALRSA